MTEPTIVVLGGGAGGVVAANELHSRLKEKAKIIVVERSPKQSFAPSYLWVMTGERQPDAISRDISRLERKDIEVIAGEIESIDTKNKAVFVQGREVNYDYLIVALGASLDAGALPGLVVDLPQTRGQATAPFGAGAAAQKAEGHAGLAGVSADERRAPDTSQGAG